MNIIRITPQPRTIRTRTPTSEVPDMNIIRITPQPTEAEVAAILSAYEALWPRPVAGDEPPAPPASRWRFSGRWWIAPATTRRRRQSWSR